MLARVARLPLQFRPAQARQVGLHPLPQTLDGVVNMDMCIDTFCPCGMCESNRRAMRWDRPLTEARDVSTSEDIRRLMERRRVKMDAYKGRLTLDGATLKVMPHG